MNLNFKLQTKKSKIDGTGAFALEIIPARKKLGNLGGEVISKKEALKRIAKTKRITMVEFNDETALDGTVNPNDLRYINHSCSPNTYMRRSFHRVEFYSLRLIKKGEELTCDYGETHHDGKLKCNCGAPNCKSFL